MFDDLRAFIAKLIKWVGIGGGIKLAIFFFGAGVLIVVLHFLWIFFYGFFKAILYTIGHWHQIFSTK